MTTVYRGDTFPITVSWFLPNPDNPYLETDAAINSATVRIVRLRDNSIVVSDEPATIDDNETMFIVPSSAVQIVSDYSAFVTVTFNDGNVLTQRIDFTVDDKR